PEGCGAAIDMSTWQVPPLFTFLQKGGNVERNEMFDVFNMGIGLVAVVSSDAVDEVQTAARAADVPTWVIGEVVEGQGVQLH
ncbi:MAG: phosphoribosylformylglycinamidine cyclo-ligase, partial [Gemmatimonadetes bacterium]|nr:phosphoribosylformylglycinamidine cyclo-ligase [Gemmatimonadota bacterium]